MIEDILSRYTMAITIRYRIDSARGLSRRIGRTSLEQLQRRGIWKQRATDPRKWRNGWDRIGYVAHAYQRIELRCTPDGILGMKRKVKTLESALEKAEKSIQGLSDRRNTNTVVKRLYEVVRDLDARVKKLEKRKK